MHRVTKETDVLVELEIYGDGNCEISTGIGFFDHMLEAFSKHSLIDLKVVAKGDLHVDFHHTVEDVGIVIGKCLAQAIYPVGKIARFADSISVMDEAAVSCALDLSNRAFLVYEIAQNGKIGEFDSELFEEFFRALAFNAGITLHLNLLRGKNSHHIAEAAFKALAISLKKALKKQDRGSIPSTKGVL